MSVRIRLRRMGTRKKAFYRIVVADQRTSRDGRFIELLGTYDPRADPPLINLDNEKAQGWLAKGAQPSDVVRSILVRQGVLEKTARPAHAAKARPAEAEQPAVEEAKAPAAPAPEAAAETAPADESAPAEEPVAADAAPAEEPPAGEAAAAEEPVAEVAPVASEEPEA